MNAQYRGGQSRRKQEGRGNDRQWPSGVKKRFAGKEVGLFKASIAFPLMAVPEVVSLALEPHVSV